MKLFVAAGLATLLALPLSAGLTRPAAAQGFDPGAMTQDERAAFREEIRAYLLENPEVLMEALGVLEEREAAAQAEADAALVAAHEEELFASPHDWVGGNLEGDVTVVEFLDYRCGYCRRAFPEVEELVASDGNIRLVVKEFPILGEQSVFASRFAIATRMVAGDAAYKEVHDRLMALRGDVNELSLELVAEEVGLDAAAIIERMNDEEVTEIIRANHRLAQILEINGTPTFVFGDRLVRGYLPLDGMRDLVAEERADG
jgi:protein-disulfide isomerase